MTKVRKSGVLVYGVGINDADYRVQLKETVGYKEDGKLIQRKVWTCPYYIAWGSVLQRSYSELYQTKYPTYKGCETVQDWHYFMTFRSWMITQNWQGKALDKDILYPGNKVYGPNTCVFIDTKVNLFLTERRVSLGGWPVGVNFHKASGKFVAQCRDIITNKQKHLGLYDGFQEAHRAWLSAKIEQAHILAAEQTDPRVAAALIDRYENYSKYFPQPR